MAKSCDTCRKNADNPSKASLIKFIFVACGIDDIVDGMRDKPPETEVANLKSWKKDDAKVKFVISSAIDIKDVECVLTCQSGCNM